MTKKQATVLVLTPYLGVDRDVTQLVLDGKTSSASDKLQVLPMMRAMIDLGAKTRALSINKFFQLKDLEKLGNPDLCVISKLRSHPSEDSNIYAMFHQACVLNLKRNGTKIITIYSDHLAHLEEPDGELYANNLFLSDAIVTPTTTLADHARSWARPETPISIIRDPCIIHRHRFTPLENNEQCRVLWFGNNSNIEYLQASLSPILSNIPRQRQFEFSFLATSEGVDQIRQMISKFKKPTNCTFRYPVWDYFNQPAQLQSELNEAHITLIPSDPLDPRKSGVSHNRLTDSIQSGCIAIASPMKSYQELLKVSLQGNDMAALFHKAVNENNRLCKKYEALRDEYIKPFDPNINKQHWQALAKTLLFKDQVREQGRPGRTA